MTKRSEAMDAINDKKTRKMEKEILEGKAEAGRFDHVLRSSGGGGFSKGSRRVLRNSRSAAWNCRTYLPYMTYVVYRV